MMVRVSLGLLIADTHSFSALISGMVRSSLGSNASGDNDGQYTPAIRQFSAPKSFKDYPTE